MRRTGKGDPVDASLKRKVVAGTVAALAVGGAGAGVAATKLGRSPSDESQAVITDAAKKLGVAPLELNNALKQALEDHIDRAVADGRMTKAKEDEILSGADERINDFVNMKLLRPPRPERWFRHRPDFGERPPLFPDAA